MNMINFFIVKMLVKVKFANIINITAGEEVIPELLQSKCNSKEIFSVVDKLLTDQHALHAISAYTNHICRTQSIDSFAKDGITFKKAFSPCALCTPARTSLLTVLYPQSRCFI